MANDEGTYYENFLSSVELLPNDMRRDFELMRELDRESIDFNRDLIQREMEYLLKVKNAKTAHEGSISSSSAVNNPNEEVAGLAKSLEEINTLRQRVKQRLSEKTGIAQNLLNDISKFCKKLDNDLASFEGDLRNFGEIDDSMNVIGPAPGTDVAIRPLMSKTDIILGRVLQYYGDIGVYDIADVDDNSKTYHLSENQVILLDMAEKQKKVSKGEEVYCLYPDTTTFYPATVVHNVKKSMAGAASIEPTVTVMFHGDQDEAGATPLRLVSLHYVIRPPFAVTY